MRTEKYLSVSATIKTPKYGSNARYSEDKFADEVHAALLKGGRISNYGINFEDPSKFDLYTLVWREADSSWAKEPLNQPEKTEVLLRKTSERIKKALKKYTNVKILLVTTVTKTEVL